MFLRQITDESLAQNAYLIGCQRTGEAIIIDPERDVDRYLQTAEENGLRITAVAETHIHADYLSGARELVERHGARAYLSKDGGPDWQFEWAKGHTNAHFISGGEVFKIGNIHFKAISSPGHTPEHLSFLVTDHGGGASEPMGLLSGDFIFVGDVGRPDLLESAAGEAGAMEPSARDLYASLRATAHLPAHLQIWPAHGAGSACGKALGALPMSVLGYERQYNGALSEAMTGTEDNFVSAILSGQPEPPKYFARMKRDNKLGPALLPHGELPQPQRIHLEELLEQPALVPLDLRNDRNAFMHKHVPGSLFAPLRGGKLPIVAGSYLNEDQSVVLLVNDDSEVATAVRQLIRIGIDHIAGWMPITEAISSQSRTRKSIPTTELATALASHPGARALDVRSATEYAESHVNGGLHVPYTRLAARLEEVPRDCPLYVHCGSGLRSSFASAYLAREQFDVIHVDGAFESIPSALLQPHLASC